MITIVSRRKSWSVQDMINDHVVQWLLPLTIELDIDKYTKYWHTKKWLQISQIGKMQYKVWSLILLHCSALVWVFSRTNSHAFLKKVFSRTNSHAFLKYLAENKGRPPVLIIPLNISPSPHLLIFDLNIYLVWFKIFHPTVL